MKKFKELTTKLRGKKIVWSQGGNSPTGKQALKSIKESVWVSYRDQALLEAAPKPEDQGKMLHCFTCGKPRIFKDNGKLKCPVCGTKKAIGEETERESMSHGERMKAEPVTPHSDAIEKVDTNAQVKKQQAEHDKNTLSMMKRQVSQRPTVKEASQSDFPYAGKVVKDPFGKNTYHFYSGTHGKRERDEYAKHLRSIGNTIKLGSRKPGQYHIVKAHLAEDSSAPHPGRVMDFASHTEHSYHGGVEAKKDRDTYAKHLQSLGHTVKKSSTPNQILHGTWGNVYHVSYKPTHLKESEIAFNESGPESYKVGDRVVPKIGPHKGEVHKVIHVHPTGHLNITPENSGYGRKNRYHLGAARAHPNDVTRHLGESLAGTWRHDHHDSQRSDPGKWLKNRTSLSTLADLYAKGKKSPAEKMVDKLTNRKTVQEVFAAAKDKKKGENPFAKKDTDKDTKPQKELVDNLPTDGANEPNKDVGAQPPQFGKQAGPEGEKKTSNTPKPEKKTGKIEVQGSGPDDKFQADPIVTPLTTMPDTASPKSGSQGVR